jgi:hypothetical protein
LGALVTVALVLVALALPGSLGLRDHVEDSWIARTVLSQPHRTLQRLRDTADRLLTEPPRVNGLVLTAGVSGLAVATVAAGRLRGAARSAALAAAPTRRVPRTAVGEAEAFDPLAWARTLVGVGIGLTLAAGLVFFIKLQ